MEKRLWAIVVKQSLLGVAVVFVAGATVDYLFSSIESRSPISTGFYCVLAYVVASIVLSIANAITGALYTWLFAERDLTDSILDDLRGLRLPPPEPFNSKNYDYLSELADDEGAPFEDRMKAVALAATYKVHMSKGLFRSLALRKAIDSAMLRYSQEAPRRQS